MSSTVLTMHTDPEQASGQLRHSRNQLFPEAQDPPLPPERVNRVKQELDEHNSEMSLHLLEDDVSNLWYGISELFAEAQILFL